VSYSSFTFLSWWCWWWRVNAGPRSRQKCSYSHIFILCTVCWYVAHGIILLLYHVQCKHIILYAFTYFYIYFTIYRVYAHDYIKKNISSQHLLENDRRKMEIITNTQTHTMRAAASIPYTWIYELHVCTFWLPASNLMEWVVYVALYISTCL
jgi:hypothetical protein